MAAEKVMASLSPSTTGKKSIRKAFRNLVFLLAQATLFEELVKQHRGHGLVWKHNRGSEDREESSTFVMKPFRYDADYVTRRFNASSAGLK